MNIEGSKENREKLAHLLTVLHDGTQDDNGRVLRPPLSAKEIANKLGLARQTVWSWSAKRMWPLGHNTLEGLSAIVGAGDAAFQSYFDGVLSLKDLLSLGNVVRPKENLEDVWGRFLELEPADQLQFEGRVLLRRAENLELSNQTELTISSRSKATLYKDKVSSSRNSVNLANALISQNRDGDMTQAGSKWSDKELLRVQALLQESLKKNSRAGKPKRPGAAAIRAGISSSSFDDGDLEILLQATLETLREIRFSSGLVNALAAICYEVVRWDGIFPTVLNETTYHNRPDVLRRDLINHEHQQA